ncbi:RagB/SusD family nutrient uptake outer membrane protein [uncultured Draconibacterium sp.]|uniref:RagB/SusD family nutrient uptake outer membrane protein n=1 Tax=uncultured Draconibacterium sp. TaxID=1573823 RepID=UPI0025F2861D|nr:RagB/SusD family nutrient uptake outer membrane protein [uncultured Draconibacterium sp.]
MKKLIIKYMAIGLILFTAFACEDFLTETNPNMMSTDSFWKTLDDTEMGLNAVYNSFKNGSVMRTSDEYNRSDMTWPGWGRPNTTNSYYLQTFTNASDGPNSKWDALYKGIFRANQVIEALTALEGTGVDEERWTEQMGQAKFFRGLFYFYLHSSFNNGSVLIYDFVPQDEADFYQTVRPADEVRAFFTADLEYAHQNLPGKWEARDLGRVTAGSAAAVLGKSYLYAEEYAKAAEYFKDVIENPDYGYALADHIGDNFTTQNELNSESILEIVYSLNYKAEESVWAEENTSSTLNFTVSPVGGWRSIYPSCWLIMAYKNDAMDVNDPRNYVTDQDGNSRLRTYNLRTSYSIALVDDVDMQYYGVITAEGANFNNKETAYWRKHSNWDICENEKDISQATPRSGVNYRVIRLADVYLMYAEALIQGGAGGDVEEALKFVNRVRHRSALQLLGMDGTGEFPGADHDDVTYDAQSLMHHLMYVERPLELSAEGHAIRTIDMRRWGITHQRFQELSQLHYHTEHYPFVDSKGENRTRWGSILIEGEKDANDLVDYVQAAQNYNEAAHAYWPIPNSETTTNPEIN